MPTPATRAGRLLLVPTPLADVAETPLDSVLPQASIAAAADLEHWIVENAKTARAFLGAVHAVQPLRVPLQQHGMAVLPKHGRLDAAALRAMLQPCLDGADMGLMSEAGAPCVADPGALVVAHAHELGIPVVPLVGPSALLLGLMASGLDGQRFAFHGYLPVEADARDGQIRLLERESAQRRQTQLFIETPYRNNAVLQALIKTLKPSTRLTVASNLTSPHAAVHTRSVAQWREANPTALEKVPCIFGFLAS
ncbi:ribosomal RNA small subunit methyltransferase I [mine drainage metagenome]|uniref:Ribosomal RNA small subunit methyltransferase I n=1 Tax=mine drainage metagenome TaxID=410659 RepID=A0A1J5RH43_9ZZZZ